jgi:RimJ/RimL family protein N-acetyltransferase
MDTPTGSPVWTRTERLDLRRPSTSELGELFRICNDPRVWTHYPSLRHTRQGQTLAMIDRWSRDWDAEGLGIWTVRLNNEDAVIGYGGCSARPDTFWNLGYRFAADQHGHGYATELASEAIRQARLLRPDLPVVAYLLEHNAASAHIARKLGLTLIYRGPDVGNPDSSAVRLIYADRSLTEPQFCSDVPQLCRPRPAPRAPCLRGSGGKNHACTGR